MGVGDDEVVDFGLGDVELFGCLVHQLDELDELYFAAGGASDQLGDRQVQPYLGYDF